LFPPETGDVYRLEQAQFRGPQQLSEDQKLETPLLPGLTIDLRRVFQ
jgi:hypothetical protein